MTEKYTAEQVLDTLAKVVAGKEDFVYRLDQRNEYGNVQCNYAEDDGSPSCIVGHVAATLDPDLFRDLVEEERDGGSFGVMNASHYFRSHFERRALAALRAAQNAQDDGLSWGTAYIEARNAI